jgi:hypothetical protein
MNPVDIILWALAVVCVALALIGLMMVSIAAKAMFSKDEPEKDDEIDLTFR